MDGAGVSFDSGFSSPFWSAVGGTSTTAVPWLLPVALDGKPLLVDLAGYRRRTLPALRTSADQGAEAGEQSLSVEGAWRRTVRDWSRGSGQRRLDDTGERQRDRFRASSGIDPWEAEAIRLLPLTETVRAGGTGLLLVAVDDRLYATDGSSLLRCDAPAAATPTFSAVSLTGLTGAITGITTDGGRVWVADGNGIWRADVGASSGAQHGTAAADRLWAVNGRLLCAKGAELFESAADGTKTTVWTHPNTSWTWTAAVGAPNGIYVAGRARDVGAVYFVGLTSAGALATPVVAAPWPVGERPLSLAYAAGLVIIGSSVGIRTAAIGDRDHLVVGRLIRTDAPVEAMVTDGRFVWFSWSPQSATRGGLGRLSLDRTSQPLVPAWATDLAVGQTGSVPAVARVAGRTWWSMAGVGLLRDSATTLEPEGWIASGMVSWGTGEPKSLVALEVAHDPLAGEVAAWVDLPDGRSVAAGSSVLQGSTTVRMGLPSERTDEAEVRLVLRRSATDPAAGPVVRRWTLRAQPVPARVDEIVLPVVAHSVVQAGADEGGMPIPQDTLALWRWLSDLVTTGRVVSYQEGLASYAVRVDATEVQPVRWRDDRSTWEATIVVRLLTVRA
jgi:hypothetical protein